MSSEVRETFVAGESSQLPLVNTPLMLQKTLAYTTSESVLMRPVLIQALYLTSQVNSVLYFRPRLVYFHKFIPGGGSKIMVGRMTFLGFSLV